ncbi:MAG TPA: FHA domain-containing protein [Pyrinomonadaceae bacterium]|nr:FHA domain-containing protein [Pyrinomonadaceae bacterium]
MSSELTLSFTDANGAARRVVVSAPRFFIGRSAENDLTIADSNLSRRHAVIETRDGLAYISDCGSRNGTLVNDQYINVPRLLRDGDLISLGGSCLINVALRPPTTPTTPTHDAPGHTAQRHATPAHAAPAHAASAHSIAPTRSSVPINSSAPTHSTASTAPNASAWPAWLKPQVVAALVSSLVILVAAVLLYALTRGGGSGEHANDGDDASVARVEEGRRRRRDETNRVRTEATTETANDDAANDNQMADATPVRKSTGALEKGLTPAPEDDARPAATGESAARAETDEEIARAARRVMSRISSDNTPYISEAGVRDVAARVRSYRGSNALQERLRAMQRGCPDVSAQAQKINLKPVLVMYAALAQSEAGGGDAVAVARQMMPKLLTLRATFGTATANSSLLLVAAYPYPFNPPIGSQTRTPHPLYTKLVQAGGHRSTVETSVARSVWFLREKGSIDTEAYELVVRLLAIGIIAQNPQRYDINADPLLC